MLGWPDLLPSDACGPVVEAEIPVLVCSFVAESSASDADPKSRDWKVSVKCKSDTLDTLGSSVF